MIIAVPSAPCGLTELYDAVATEMGCADTSELNYDRTKINIAKNIQDGLYAYYAAVAKEANPDVTMHEVAVATTMLLAAKGPKVDESLNANEVEVFDGFIC